MKTKDDKAVAPDKDTMWFLRQNLQNSIDELLRAYEEKGVMVHDIEIVMLPPHPSKKSKPYTRVSFFKQ